MVTKKSLTKKDLQNRVNELVAELAISRENEMLAKKNVDILSTGLIEWRTKTRNVQQALAKVQADQSEALMLLNRHLKGRVYKDLDDALRNLLQAYISLRDNEKLIPDEGTTPGPWWIREHPKITDEFFLAASATKDHPYFGVTKDIQILSDEDYPAKRADAELIVKAVNAYRKGAL